MTERTPGGWHHHIEEAKFEELVWRDGSGRVCFDGEQATGPKRFRERVWRCSTVPARGGRPPRRGTSAGCRYRRSPMNDR